MTLTTTHSHDPELTAMVYNVDILYPILALADSAFYVRYQILDEKVFGQPVINAHGSSSLHSWHPTPKSPREVF
jgi:hypothetical protein